MTAAAAPGAGVVVVGAGVAGSEAAWSLARAGVGVDLVTTSLDTVYRPAADRVALDAPAGSLGAVVAGSLTPDGEGRLSAWALHRAVKYALEAEPRVHLLQASVSELAVADGTVTGVRTWEGIERTAPAVALTVGSFLRARLRVGRWEEHAGRLGEMSYDDLADDLERHGFAFEAASYDATASEGHPGYRVRFLRFPDDELDGTRLARLGGAWSAGVVARGPLDYAACVRDGRALADQLFAVSSRGSV